MHNIMYTYMIRVCVFATFSIPALRCKFGAIEARHRGQREGNPTYGAERTSVAV